MYAARTSAAAVAATGGTAGVTQRSGTGAAAAAVSARNVYEPVDGFGAAAPEVVSIVEMCGIIGDDALKVSEMEEVMVNSLAPDPDGGSLSC